MRATIFIFSALLSFCLQAFSPPAAPAATSGAIRVSVTDKEGTPLPGASLTLTGSALSAPLEALTDDGGRYLFSRLVPGLYTVSAWLEGFEKINAKVEVGESTVELVIQLPPEVRLAEEIVVKAGEESIAGRAETSTRDVVAEKALDTTITPLREDRFQEALPLLPGVLRGPDGLLNIKGARATESRLLVNSANVTDPVTGEFGINLPIDAVESVQVISNPYSAEHGRFTGGIASLETKPGGDKFKFQINNFIPRLRRRAGTIAGIEAFTPRLRASGPLVKGKLSFSQSFQYRFIRTRVPSLPALENDMVLESFDSFSQLDYQINQNNSLTATFSLFPQKNDFVNMNTFNPREVTANLKQKGFNFSLYHRLLLDNGGFLESVFNVKRFESDIFGQGLEPLSLEVERNRGNFYNRQERESFRYQLLETYTFPTFEIFGRHTLKLGVELGYTTFDGRDRNSPVLVRRADGTISQRIDFFGPGLIDINNKQLSLFAQDRWTVNSSLALDLGLRYDLDSITDSDVIAPRLGFLISPFKDQKTLLKGGAGLFYGEVPLAVGAFEQFQSRIVTRFAPDGATVIGVPLALRHMLPQRLHAPYSIIWNFEIDRQLAAGLFARFNYMERRGKREFIIDPAEEAGALMLSSRGRSRYREYQFTVAYKLSDESEANFSYVRSRSLGDLNDFNQFFGNFRNPIIRKNEFSLLPHDAPDRFLFWGSFALPFKLVLAPVLEIRDGFPFSHIDQERFFIGPRNRAGRFPTFASLDLQISKEIKIKGYRARVGFKVFNVTNHFNPRDVQSNLDSLAFGGFFNSVGRTFRGTFQIIN